MLDIVQCPADKMVCWSCVVRGLHHPCMCWTLKVHPNNNCLLRQFVGDELQEVACWYPEVCNSCQPPPAPFTGCQVFLALSPELSQRQGGDASIHRATAIPTLLPLAPSEPGPSACATLPPVSTPSHQVFLTPALHSGAPLCTLWPVMVPIDAAAEPCALSVTATPPHALSLCLPPYMSLACTTVLAATLQLSARVAAASHLFVVRLGQRVARGAHPEGRQSQTWSLQVGASGYQDPLVVSAEISVRFPFTASSVLYVQHCISG